MKIFNLYRNLIGLSLIIVLFSCEDDEPISETVDFEADFFTVLVSFEEDAGCTAPRNFLNTQQGNGTASLVGDFTTQLTFCVNPATFEYENVQGSFVAENGDELFITGGGQVVPTNKEGYDLEFKDPFTIAGGTGRFEGAMGNGFTESYVNMTTGQTDHIWTGTITTIR